MQIEIKIPEHAIITADSEKVTIEHRGLRSFANHGGTGSSTIPYSAIASIDYKKPGITRGHIIIVPISGSEHGGGLGGLDPLYAGSAWSKKNAIIFGKKHQEEMNKLVELINKKIALTNSNITVSSADELAKLNHFTISGNTRISSENLDKIRQGLIKTIE